MTEVSTIIYVSGATPSRQHVALLKEAERVATLGGSFSIRHYYSTNWYEEFRITYPEPKEI